MVAMALKITVISNLNTNGVLSLPPNRLHSHLLCSNPKFCGRRFIGSAPLSLSRSKKSWHGSLQVSNLSQSSASNSFDVVIVGAGIIGLTIARHLLLASDLSVALVDAAVPCSGATGAGQGYIWKAHKSPGTEKWELMMRSHQLWENLAKSIQLQGMDPLEELGWKKTGSLLVSKTAAESAMLKERVEELSQEGLRAEFLSTNDLLSEEPELVLEQEGGAAFFPDDYQLDVHRTVAFIAEGHLLVIENFKSFKLNHGIMETGYANHQSATLNATASNSGPVYNAQDLSVSMTATIDVSGNLVLGSSRQLVGFSTEVDESVINHIWQRVGEFIPALRQESLEDLRQSREVRVGLRPYIPDGKPVIGLVPGFSNVFLAAGHEGEGLSLALGTAEMIADMVLGNPCKVDATPFALLGRCFH
ncbi:glycine oxidase isoform X3 [Capsicum annuum]|uniref:glycine oxidase isoform X3 n=1 Tax=Capsicum annuum TaxID=4072 RepID=UPI0007BFCD2D|nr:glycine oxidase isoform X3 [Capsicum annuum]